MRMLASRKADTRMRPIGLVLSTGVGQKEPFGQSAAKRTHRGDDD
jgi:hypothetical protein